MSNLDACFDREQKILQGELDRGEIDNDEYCERERELELEYGDFLRGGK